MTASKQPRLNDRDRFMVTNFLIANIEAVHALRTQEARVRFVSNALGVPLTVAKLQTAAGAAHLSLAPPPIEKAPKVLSKAELYRLVLQLAERVDALEADKVKTADCLVRANEYSKALEQRVRAFEGASKHISPIGLLL